MFNNTHKEKPNWVKEFAKNLGCFLSFWYACTNIKVS